MTDYNIKGGVQCADFIGGDQNITYGFSPEDVERLIEKVLALMQAGGVFLPAPDQQDALQIEHNGQKLTFRPGAIHQLSNQSQERAYLLALTVDQEYQRWATRFVPLAGKMDMRQVIEGLPISFTEFIIPTGEAGMQAQATQRPLKDITEAMQCHGAFVILGEPGAGKTTTQQKIAFDMAQALLKGSGGRIPLFVRLSQQGERDPHLFLQTEWERRTGIPFAQALAQGHILILADGINEIPREKRNERLIAWMSFEKEYRGNNQMIFSGRAKDYDNDLFLPRVLVEPLDEARIHDFLQRHKAEGLADLLDDPTSRLGEMASNPLNLFVLVMVYHKGGRNLQVLANRGRLFESFSWELMSHEQKWHRDAFSVDSKIELFARLAYDMQKQGSGTTFDLESAQNALPKQVLVMGEPVSVEAAAVFRFGRGASILDPLTLPDVRFYHHLLQEYFAARELLRRFNTGEELSAFWKALRTKEEMPAEEVGEWDPLPEPPTTGWEVTTILACGLSSDPAKLIEAVRQHNHVLAGRCLDEAGIQNNGMEVKKAVRADLLDDLYNPAMHLRARLQAGFILGRIGDPRFENENINGSNIILPQMVEVPDGHYTIGASENDSYASLNEKPIQSMYLNRFLISKWPITNFLFECFIANRGYKDIDNWKTNLSKEWLLNENFEGGQFNSWLNIWKHLKKNPDWKEEYEKGKKLPPNSLKYYEHIVNLSENEFKTELSSKSKKKSREKPHFRDDRIFNNPSQPVVGITWFEANAYCAWLSKLTQEVYRLPTEFEWEASVRAFDTNIYPFGDTWIEDIANTVESRIWRPTPVGLFTSNGCVSKFGVEDPVGNVWNWTSSPYSYYPYEENANFLESSNERVLRGGSWSSSRHFSRISVRVRDAPEYYDKNIGFRVVKETRDV